MNILIYLSFIALLLLIPTDKLSSFFDSFLVLTQKRGLNKSRPLVQRGQALLKMWPLLFTPGEVSREFKLPEYKFYTDLLHRVLTYRRLLGAKISEVGPFLRHSLNEDYQFNLKTNKQIQHGLLQFFIMSAMTWLFILFSSQFGPTEIEYFFLISILLLQLAGISFYLFAQNFLQKKYLAHTDQWIQTLIEFRVVSGLGLSQGEVMKFGNLRKLSSIKGEFWQEFYQQWQGSLERWRSGGLSILPIVEHLLEETQFQRSLSFDTLIKASDGLKLMVMALFFLSGYFIYLWRLFSGLLGH